MNISKCLKKYNYEKSEEITTDVRGQHEFTNGYGFLELESDVFLIWNDDKMKFDKKFEIIKDIKEKLDRHGLCEYVEFHEEIARIKLLNFVN